MPYVPDILENEQRCSCPGCPSNPTPDGILWCARQPHAEAAEQRGCICEQCPIFRVYDLAGQYYCMGSVAQRHAADLEG